MGVVDARTVEANDGSSRLILSDFVVPIQNVPVRDDADPDPLTFCNRITIKYDGQVVCKSEPINPDELPGNGSKPLAVPLFGKIKNDDGKAQMVRQGEIYL